MGKPSKNSGGDERMYDRRYRASSNSKASSTEKQGEAESSNRSKQVSAPALKPNSGVIKNKTKGRSPAKIGLGNPTNRINRSNIVSEDKGVKKSGVVVKDKSQVPKMKQQTENLERKDKKIESTEAPEQVIENVKQVIDEVIDNSFNQHENGANGKETSSSNGNGAESVDVNEKEEDFNLLLDTEENGKHEENGVKDSSDTVENENGEKIEETVDEPKSIEENAPSDTNSCSVDVVESTTSETSEPSEPTKPSEVEDKEESQDVNEDENTDSTKKLKDVQIKLHDCLKEKNEDENGADQSAPEYRHKEDTFGKTLRTLSGRKSIGRHITIRERQPSPNSSLYVNTSSVSVSEDGNTAYKSLYQQRTALSELTSSNNGTPLDKKRKFIEEAVSSPKKPKTEGSSLLNSSFEFLKYPFSRRPVEVSTPYKFGEVEKPNTSSSEEVKPDDETGAGRRWCVVM